MIMYKWYLLFQCTEQNYDTQIVSLKKSQSAAHILNFPWA